MKNFQIFFRKTIDKVRAAAYNIGENKERGCRNGKRRLFDLGNSDMKGESDRLIIRPERTAERSVIMKKDVNRKHHESIFDADNLDTLVLWGLYMSQLHR